MSDEYEYESVNYDSNCKYAIYAVNEPPNKHAFDGKCFVYSKPDDYFFKYRFYVRCYL